MKKIFLALLVTVLFMNCNREFYKTGDYDRLAYEHRVVAILPAESITTGRIPDLTKENIEDIEEAESKAFQISLYRHVARKTGDRIQISVQHYAETNRLLEDAGISFRDSWKASPKKLAEVLGVDAVVHSTVEKEFYLTNLESFGIELGQVILGAIFNHGVWFPGISRTSDVFVSCDVIDGKEGLPIWTTHKVEPTYWNRPHREVIDQLTRAMSRRFPYRD
jgi:hypothetical protein